MAERIDELSSQLWEQAKQFSEKAKAEADPKGQAAYRNAALMLGFCALEAHLNALAEESAMRTGLGVLEKSILTERDVALDAGKFTVTNRLKIYRLEDRLEFLFVNFARGGVPKGEKWWAQVKEGIRLRNELVHPKAGFALTEAALERNLLAILECLNALYLGIYRKRFPSYQRGLDSQLTF